MTIKNLELRRKLAQLSARQLGLFTVDQVEAIGGTRRLIDSAIAAREIQRVYPGVLRQCSVPRSWEQDVLAAQLWLGAGALVSHRSAARLLGLGSKIYGVVELTSPKRRKPRSGVILHNSTELLPGDTAKAGPIAVTTPTRTLLDLGSVVAPDELEGALDDALRRGRTTLQRLLRRMEKVESPKGRRGLGPLRELIDERTRTRLTGSDLETLLYRRLRQHRLPLPQKQFHVIVDGKPIARVDFAYPANRLVLEVESYEWHSSPRSWSKDITRLNELTSDGWAVIRVTHHDLVHQPQVLMGKIRRYLSASFRADAR